MNINTINLMILLCNNSYLNYIKIILCIYKLNKTENI